MGNPTRHEDRKRRASEERQGQGHRKRVLSSPPADGRFGEQSQRHGALQTRGPAAPRQPAQGLSSDKPAPKPGQVITDE